MKTIDYKSFIKKKLQNKKVVFTNGCFDILHTGHIKLLKEAKSLYEDGIPVTPLPWVDRKTN